MNELLAIFENDDIAPYIMKNDNPVRLVLEPVYRCLKAAELKRYPYYTYTMCTTCYSSPSENLYWYAPRASMVGDCKTCSMVLPCKFGASRRTGLDPMPYLRRVRHLSHLILITSCQKCGVRLIVR